MTKQNVTGPKSTHQSTHLDPKAVHKWQSLMTVLRELVPNTPDTHHQGYSVYIEDKDEDGKSKIIVGRTNPNTPDMVQNDRGANLKENWYSLVIAHLAGQSGYTGPLLVRGPLVVTQYNGDLVPVTMDMHIGDVISRLDTLVDFWKQQYNVSLQYNIRERGRGKPAKLHMSIP
jgi:hypothetical protein